MSKRRLLILILKSTLFLTLFIGAGLSSHTASLGSGNAVVSGQCAGSYVYCPGCMWDRKFSSCATHVGLSNGVGNTITVKYSWKNSSILGDYHRVTGISIFDYENSHCYPAVDNVYVWNNNAKKWDYAFHTDCGGTRTFSRTYNGDNAFNYADNSVTIRLSSYNVANQKVCELGVSRVDYWYNWFPRAEFKSPGTVYINQTINDTYSLTDKDGDKLNHTESWFYNGKKTNLTNITKLKIGDTIVHSVMACDPYNCTVTNRTIHVINFIPELKINYPRYVKGNKSLSINASVYDLKMENQTHNITCQLENKSISKSASIGQTKISMISPKNEGNYTLECTACDGLNCTSVKNWIVVDNTPPKFTNITIPACTNLKNIIWKTNEPSKLNITSDFVNNLKEGKTILCVSPVDRAGNVGKPVCKNATIDLSPPSINWTNPILLPGQNFTIRARDSCGVTGTTVIGNETFEFPGNYSTKGMHRGNNTVFLNITDNAGNRLAKNITVRVNLVPNVSISMPTIFADSKELCRFNVSNEPDQPYNVTRIILVNNQRYNGTLKRGDKVECIVNATDSLNETGMEARVTTVQNKPPELEVKWTPTFPEPGDEVKFEIETNDIDGDNVTLKARFSNRTWNKTIYAFRPNIKMPGNYSLNISAWDGFNWTNLSFNIPYHLCGNRKKELGEECDGNAPVGYICKNCILVRMHHTTSTGGGAGGSYAKPEITPRTWRIGNVSVTEKPVYKLGIQTKTAWSIQVETRMPIILETKIPDSFLDGKLNCPGECRINGGMLVWKTNKTANASVTANKELLLGPLMEFLKSKPAPEIQFVKQKAEQETTEQEPKKPVNKPETKPKKKNQKRQEFNVTYLTSEEWALPPMPKKTSVEEVLDVKPAPVMVKRPETAMITEKSPLLNGLLSLVILIFGFKYRRNLRRLGIRLKAMRTKMRPRKSDTIRLKDLP